MNKNEWYKNEWKLLKEPVKMEDNEDNEENKLRDSKLPKQLFVIENSHDFHTHSGNSKVADVLENINTPTVVGIYKLVGKKIMISKEITVTREWEG